MSKADALLAFVAKYLGRSNVGDTLANAGQCVGLVEMWLAANRQPHVWGNACQLLANADPSRYVVTHNTPTNVPPPGAVICWDCTWGSGAGHTAVVLAANVRCFVCVEQNDPMGSPCVVGTHDYTHVLGWLTW